MPRAVSIPVREEIVRRHQQGQELTTIATDLRLSYYTVRQIWHLYHTQGATGRAPRYHACARLAPADSPAILQQACELKRLHPTWGAGLIRVQITKQFVNQNIPSVRTLQ